MSISTHHENLHNKDFRYIEGILENISKQIGSKHADCMKSNTDSRRCLEDSYRSLLNDKEGALKNNTDLENALDRLVPFLNAVMLAKKQRKDQIEEIRLIKSNLPSYSFGNKKSKKSPKKSATKTKKFPKNSPKKSVKKAKKSPKKSKKY
jgi:hypothetical protein